MPIYKLIKTGDFFLCHHLPYKYKWLPKVQVGLIIYSFQLGGDVASGRLFAEILCYLSSWVLEGLRGWSLLVSMDIFPFTRDIRILMGISKTHVLLIFHKNNIGNQNHWYQTYTHTIMYAAMSNYMTNKKYSLSHFISYLSTTLWIVLTYERFTATSNTLGRSNEMINQPAKLQFARTYL